MAKVKVVKSPDHHRESEDRTRQAKARRAGKRVPPSGGATTAELKQHAAARKGKPLSTAHKNAISAGLKKHHAKKAKTPFALARAGKHHQAFKAAEKIRKKAWDASEKLRLAKLARAGK